MPQPLPHLEHGQAEALVVWTQEGTESRHLQEGKEQHQCHPADLPSVLAGGSVAPGVSEPLHRDRGSGAPRRELPPPAASSQGQRLGRCPVHTPVQRVLAAKRVRRSHSAVTPLWVPLNQHTWDHRATVGKPATAAELPEPQTSVHQEPDTPTSDRSQPAKKATTTGP